jgi:hypothetical protein
LSADHEIVAEKVRAANQPATPSARALIPRPHRGHPQ